MGFLKLHPNMWNYIPRVERTLRIPPSMMLQSWMGSDFTNDDLVRESSQLEDYAGITTDHVWRSTCEMEPYSVDWCRLQSATQHMV